MKRLFSDPLRRCALLASIAFTVLIIAAIPLPAHAGMFDAPDLLPYGTSHPDGKTVNTIKAGAGCTLAPSQDGWTRREADGSYTVCVKSGYSEAMIKGHEYNMHVRLGVEHEEIAASDNVLRSDQVSIGGNCPLIVHPGLSGAHVGDGACTTSTGAVYFVPGRHADSTVVALKMPRPGCPDLKGLQAPGCHAE